MYIAASSGFVGAKPAAVSCAGVPQAPACGHPACQSSLVARVAWSDERTSVSLGLASGLVMPNCASDGPAIPLVNISTRGRVLTGNDVMIGGFVIQGSGPQTVAIVATGPSLAAFGIASPLANPTITLVRSSDQAVLAANDDWQIDVNASQLQAAGFAPANALESGLYRQLLPGAYTVIVQGVGGGTGVAVIGVYKVQLNGTFRFRSDRIAL